MRSLYAVQRSDCDALLGVLCNTSEELRLVRRPMSIGTQIKRVRFAEVDTSWFQQVWHCKNTLEEKLARDNAVTRSGAENKVNENRDNNSYNQRGH